MQVLRTYPAKRPGYSFAPHGERSIARTYLKAFARARSLVYIEDQYMNLVAMVALATVVLTEKVSPQGERLSRVFGIGCLALAAAVLIWPGIAPGLTSMPEMMG